MKLESFLVAKDIVVQMLYQLYTNRGLVSRIYKELEKLNTKKITQLKSRVQNQTEFSKTETQMAKKYFKKCSTSLAIREIRTTLRFHLILVRMARNNKTNDTSAGTVGAQMFCHNQPLLKIVFKVFSIKWNPYLKLIKWLRI